MDREVVFRLLATKWLETAERVENRSLKQCYRKRALHYQAMAAAAKHSHMRLQQSANLCGPNRRPH